MIYVSIYVSVFLIQLKLDWQKSLFFGVRGVAVAVVVVGSVGLFGVGVVLVGGMFGVGVGVTLTFIVRSGRFFHQIFLSPG